MPEPFAASRHACGGYTTLATTQPDHCSQPVTHAGLVYYPHPRPGELWIGFACTDHADHLQCARPVIERDMDELHRRARAWRAARDGRAAWSPPKPLATGPAATALLARYLREEADRATPAPARTAPVPRRVRRAAERAALRGRPRT